MTNSNFFLLFFDKSKSLTINLQSQISALNINSAIVSNRQWNATKDKNFQSLYPNFAQVGAGGNSSELVVQLGKEDKPRGIDLDVCEGMVYWTNWNRRHPAIQRAYYSGFNRQDLITENVHMPNGLALDLAERKLYWADARLDKIEVKPVVS